MEKRPKPFDHGPLRASVVRGPDKEGRWYWRARTTTDRRTVWATWATKEEAQIAVAAIVKAGVPASSADDPRDARTVDDILQGWKKRMEKRLEAGQIAPNTLANHKRVCEYWIGSLGDVRLDRLSRTDVEDAVVEWGIDAVAPRTINAALSVLRQAFRWAVKLGHPSPDLARLTVAVRDDEFVYEDHTPAPAEAAAVIREIRVVEVRDAVHLLALAGARIGEVMALRRTSLAVETGLLTLTGRDTARGARGKTRRREFPLSAEGLELLRPRADGTDAPMFDLASRHQVNNAITRAAEKAGVHDFTPHGLRRMVAMRLLDAGVDAKTVSKLTGHTVEVLLRNYVRPKEEQLRRAVQRAGLGVLVDPDNVVEVDFAQK